MSWIRTRLLVLGTMILLLGGSTACVASKRVRLSEPRIHPVERSEGTDAQRAYLETHERAGRLFNVFKTGAHHVDLAKSIDSLAFGHINTESSLNTLLRRTSLQFMLFLARKIRHSTGWKKHTRKGLRY